MQRLGSRAVVTARSSPEKRRHPASGLITGYVLKVVRESLRLTQEELAGELDVDKHTVQAWESGRRPLTATQVWGLVDLRRHLRGLGADGRLLDALNAAVEADYVLSFALHAGSQEADVKGHPLSRWVLSRAVSEMLAWPLTQELPMSLRGVRGAPRRGPVAPAPTLSTLEKTRFFEHFRLVAESALAWDEANSEKVLLRRQAYYQLAWDDDGEMREWLEAMQRHEEKRYPRLHHGWSPQWMAVRSLAVARSRFGDREPLRRFLRTGLDGDECELANLHYWMYWVGESNTTHNADTFVLADPGPGGGGKLLDYLVERLVPENSCVDLYVRTLWALLKRPGGMQVLDKDPARCAAVTGVAEEVLDACALSPDSRRELAEIVGYLRWVQPGVRCSDGGG